MFLLAHTFLIYQGTDLELEVYSFLACHRAHPLLVTHTKSRQCSSHIVTLCIQFLHLEFHCIHCCWQTSTNTTLTSIVLENTVIKWSFFIDINLEFHYTLCCWHITIPFRITQCSSHSGVL